jgi:hypothetical protein
MCRVRLRFQVDGEFLEKCVQRQVGDVTHREYWIPTADLPAFNDKIVGSIEVIAQFGARRKTSCSIRVYFGWAIAATVPLVTPR